MKLLLSNKIFLTIAAVVVAAAVAIPIVINSDVEIDTDQSLVEVQEDGTRPSGIGIDDSPDGTMGGSQTIPPPAYPKSYELTFSVAQDDTPNNPDDNKIQVSPFEIAAGETSTTLANQSRPLESFLPNANQLQPFINAMNNRANDGRKYKIIGWINPNQQPPPNFDAGEDYIIYTNDPNLFNNEPGFADISKLVLTGDTTLYARFVPDDWQPKNSQSPSIDYVPNKQEVPQDFPSIYVPPPVSEPGTDSDDQPQEGTEGEIIYMEIPVYLVWLDDDNSEEMRRDVNLSLAATTVGVTDRHTFTIPENAFDDDLTHIFKDVVRTNAAGLTIDYDLLVDNIPGYSKNISRNDNNDYTAGFTVTLTLIQMTAIQTKVEWNDDNHLEFRLDVDLIITGLASGYSKIDTFTIYKDATGYDLVHLFDNLPTMTDTGETIIYTFGSSDVSGYSKSISGDAGAGFIVTYTIQ